MSGISCSSDEIRNRKRFLVMTEFWDDEASFTTAQTVMRGALISQGTACRLPSSCDRLFFRRSRREDFDKEGERRDTGA